MKILMIDKFYFIKGGPERYMFDLTRMLEERGHDVIPFSMKHPDNFPTPFEKYFVENIEFNMDSPVDKIVSGLRIFGRVVYSFHAKRKLARLIESAKPDIAHLHMIDHHLSPSVLDVLRKGGIPVIQTVHQYKLVCPNYRLYNPRRGQICERCLDGNFCHPIFERCHKNSPLSGALLALEMSVHKMLKTHQKGIQIFHVPSRFMGRMLVKGGFKADRIAHLALLCSEEIEKVRPNWQSDDTIIYLGRLSEEKGIVTLLNAMHAVENIRLLIVGEGPLRPALESLVSRHKLAQVSFVGPKYGEDLRRLVSRSKFVVVPSEWYENSPLVIYESFFLGKPVIGADIGGIPEFVEHEKTGLLFTPGNVEELAERINRLLHHPELIREYGIQARKKAERELNADTHFKGMMKLYDRLLNLRQGND